MLIIGCDFHSGFQQLAIFDNQTGEIQEKKLLHPDEAAEYYRCQGGASAGGHGSGCALPVVPAAVERVRA